MLRINDERLEQIKENINRVKKAHQRGDNSVFLLGGYVNVRFVSHKNPTLHIRSRKDLQTHTKKLVNESMERIKENSRKIIENR